MIFSTAQLNQYVIGLAKALYTRGFELPEGPTAEFDDSGVVVTAVVGGSLDVDLNAGVTIRLEELWRPLSERRWQRDEYTYDLVDTTRRRRRAFHAHDRALAEASLRTPVHEHCEEVLGSSACEHYLGREVPDGYVAIDLLVAAWLEPGPLGCDQLVCLE